MIFSRVAPRETIFDSKTPCWSGPRWTSVAVALRMRSGLGIQFLCVKPAMPHNVVHISASEGSEQQQISLDYLGSNGTDSYYYPLFRIQMLSSSEMSHGLQINPRARCVGTAQSAQFRTKWPTRAVKGPKRSSIPPHPQLPAAGRPTPTAEKPVCQCQTNIRIRE